MKRAVCVQVFGKEYIVRDRTYAEQLCIFADWSERELPANMRVTYERGDDDAEVIEIKVYRRDGSVAAEHRVQRRSRPRLGAVVPFIRRFDDARFLRNAQRTAEFLGVTAAARAAAVI
jgi:hypothetical protein